MLEREDGNDFSVECDTKGPSLVLHLKSSHQASAARFMDTSSGIL
jgi:hypothetical protein